MPAGSRAYLANLCLFFGDVEFFGFRENLGEAIGKAIEAAAWGAWRQVASKVPEKSCI